MRRLIATVLGLGCFFAVGPALAEQVHAKAGIMDGQANIFAHKNVCLGVTPAHVMNNGLGFASLVRRTPTLLTGEATEIRNFGYDLSLILVSGGLSSDCGAPFETVSDIGPLLETSGGKGFLRQVFSNGDTVLRPLHVVSADATNLHLEEVGGWTIGPGDSGAAVLLDGQLAGIVQRQGGPGQPATALRWDFATQLVSWELERTVPAVLSAPTADRGVAEIVVEAPNAMSMGAAYLPSNLVAPAEIGREWRAEVIAWPVDLIVSFADGNIHEIAALEISGLRGDTAINPKNVEIQRTRSASADNRWTTFDTIIVDPVAVNRFVFPGNMRIRRIRLRIYDNWGNGPKVGLGGIKLILADNF